MVSLTSSKTINKSKILKNLISKTHSHKTLKTNSLNRTLTLLNSKKMNRPKTTNKSKANKKMSNSNKLTKLKASSKTQNKTTLKYLAIHQKI